MGTAARALSSTSTSTPPAASCKWHGKPKFQGTVPCFCTFSCSLTCCISKRKANPAKPPLSSIKQRNWSRVFNIEFCLGNFNRSYLNQKGFPFCVSPQAVKNCTLKNKTPCLRLHLQHWDSKTSYLRLLLSPVCNPHKEIEFREEKL